MKTITLTAAFTIAFSIAFAQDVFRVGVVSSKGAAFKLTGEIVIADSTVSFKFNGNVQVKKIINNQQNVIYVSDGTATDRITINPIKGSLKGFNYNCSLVVDPDQRFNPIQVIYFAFN